MQFPQLALLGLGTFAFAAPAAEPEALAVPEARYGGGSHHGSSGGGSSKGGYSSACCPEGERSGCSYNTKGQCPDDKPDQYNQCTNIIQRGSALNLLLCNVLNNNTINVPVTVSLGNLPL